MSRRRLSSAGAGLLLAVAAVAQEQRVLEVHVVSVSARDVYLDLGRTSGIAVGQLVRLYPPGAPFVEVVVRAVSSTSTRAELPLGAAPPPVGTRGEVTVPKARPQPPPSDPSPPDKPVPSHPPWTRPTDARAPDAPLLVPTYGQRPDERPVTFDGRLFAALDWQRDTGGERVDEYLLARCGVSTELHNALGAGERTAFAGEVERRYVHLPDEPDTGDTRGRVDLLSTAFGTEHWAPLGVEVGRFLSPHLPEIGLVDGVEGVWRYEAGVRLGGGFGAYPRPFPSRASGDDLGLHLFYDYAADERRSLAVAVGLQKTWHQGTPDRDLLLLRAEGRPRDDLWWFASAKVDWYTHDDQRKSAGPAVTELLGQARWDGRTVGAGLSWSHFEYPDLLREEYQDLPNDLVRNGFVDRWSLSTWARPLPSLRLDGRVDAWRDQDDDGAALEVGADITDLLQSGTDVAVQLFRTDGGFQSGPGLRLSARRQCGDVWMHAGYRWYDYEIDTLLAGNESYVRQAIDAGASWGAGSFDYDVLVERWFGSQENAYALGFYMQWRF